MEQALELVLDSQANLHGTQSGLAVAVDSAKLKVAVPAAEQPVIKTCRVAEAEGAVIELVGNVWVAVRIFPVRVSLDEGEAQQTVHPEIFRDRILGPHVPARVAFDFRFQVIFRVNIS